MKTNPHSLAQNAALRSALGPYRLVGEIGRGGMAAVYLAVFANGDGTGRPTVLKQLLPDLALDHEFRTMFEDEARLATRLHHHNVVETYDVYSDPDVCVLLMEFLEGQTLSYVRQTAHRMGSLPLPIELHCLAQVLAGLDYVHDLTDEKGNPLRIVHRDVTPSNVFVTYRGGIKVVDFGIAKTSMRLAQTRVGVFKGKLVYASPEAVRGEPVDRRSDIFSVGVMLWEAVTGRRLWQDQDDLTVFRRLAGGLIPLHPPGLTISDPAAFAIAERALATDPGRRYATAAEMRRDIEDLLVYQGKAVGASTVSGYMRSCFGEERQKLQALVEEAMGWFRQPVSSHASSGSDLGGTAPVLDASEPPTTVSIPPAPMLRTLTFLGAVRPEPKRAVLPRLGMALAAGAVAVAVGVAFIANTSGAARVGSADPPQGSVALPSTSDAVPAPDPVIVAESGTGSIIATDLEVSPASITVVLSARPAEARLILDGERLEGNPVTLRRQPDKKRHRLRIEAPGFVTLSRSFDLDEDMARVFDLVRKPPPPPAPARTSPPVEPSPAAEPGCPKSRQAQEEAESPGTTR